MSVDPERLALLQRDAYTRFDRAKPHVISETADDGRAEVRVVLADGASGLAFRLDRRQVFDGLLANNKRADGFLLVHDEGGWTGHVFECKRTLNARTWSTARQQLAAGVPRLAAVAGVLGVTITRWRFWVAYRRDALAAATADPLAPEPPVGSRDVDDDASRTWAARTVDGGVIAGPVAKSTAHLIDDADDVGRGELRL